MQPVRPQCYAITNTRFGEFFVYFAVFLRACVLYLCGDSQRWLASCSAAVRP